MDLLFRTGLVCFEVQAKAVRKGEFVLMQSVKDASRVKDSGLCKQLKNALPQLKVKRVTRDESGLVVKRRATEAFAYRTGKVKTSEQEAKSRSGKGKGG
ncbi:uncharacterized protein UV8b_08058 [Ustilaginoidea virens]|uniref:Uncharacterized protein n=1 Tax=Ustilaginoidea virens TaxID=1159556 RepID=A0A8E5HYH7_USTVR|nr:uncharacterized protein UV8b_08058 [Ustilaginoidea virens]QUC23817.1 hypothetical protein UV8b_08058 [Ustilaginoidea virens]